MREGSGMVEFSQRFPDRYHDVAIAEQHAVTVAAGMACEGLRPVVAIYSTFLQRGYDQLIHDVALQNLPVLFAIDRAGLVGADGATHAGVFDVAFMRCLPNLVIMAPKDETECRAMLSTGLSLDGPSAVRYPRGAGMGVEAGRSLAPLAVGKAEPLMQGGPGPHGLRVGLLAFGSMVAPALRAAGELQAGVVNMRFIKPLDLDCLRQCAHEYDLLVTIEEHVLAGGAGAAVLEAFAAMPELGHVPGLLTLGLPDCFIDHGDHAALLAREGLDAPGIVASVRAKAAQIHTHLGFGGNPASPSLTLAQ
jgi:1-deoxy-D-xylulose-5-phosphate synthase